MFDIRQLSIWIVTYNRPESINAAVGDFLRTTPDFVPINIISNHSKLNLYRDYGPRIKIWMNTLRPDSSWGYLARNWNQCMYLGLDKYEWILCSQDDVRIKDGWLDLVQQHPNYDFYTAPFFDMMFLMNRDAFRDVGWFDERFLCVDLQDNDYLRRVYLELGEKRVCIEDRHGWKLRGRNIKDINPIGLTKFWRHGADEGYKQMDDRPRGPDKIHFRLNNAFRYQKWGIIHKVNSQELILQQRIPEIDWYPWFTERMFKLAGIPYPYERYVKLTSPLLKTLHRWLIRIRGR